MVHFNMCLSLSLLLAVGCHAHRPSDQQNAMFQMRAGKAVSSDAVSQAVDDADVKSGYCADTLYIGDLVMYRREIDYPWQVGKLVGLGTKKLFRVAIGQSPKEVIELDHRDLRSSGDARLLRNLPLFPESSEFPTSVPLPDKFVRDLWVEHYGNVPVELDIGSIVQVKRSNGHWSVAKVDAISDGTNEKRTTPITTLDHSVQQKYDISVPAVADATGRFTGSAHQDVQPVASKSQAITDSDCLAIMKTLPETPTDDIMKPDNVEAQSLHDAWMHWFENNPTK